MVLLLLHRLLLNLLFLLDLLMMEMIQNYLHGHHLQVLLFLLLLEEDLLHHLNLLFLHLHHQKIFHLRLDHYLVYLQYKKVVVMFQKLELRLFHYLQDQLQVEQVHYFQLLQLF
jgi:hypothetical protein